MTKHEPSFDTKLAEVKRLIATARPDQIKRLLQDIRQADDTNHPKGTA
ncbi:MAG: hypothetical protein NXH84_17625 [Rhodobacteraceae bacterium]|nr:hypothetical protein [Paracoccaceae bacterium]